MAAHPEQTSGYPAPQRLGAAQVRGARGESSACSLAGRRGHPEALARLRLRVTTRELGARADLCARRSRLRGWETRPSPEDICLRPATVRSARSSALPTWSARCVCGALSGVDGATLGGLRAGGTAAPEHSTLGGAGAGEGPRRSGVNSGVRTSRVGQGHRVPRRSEVRVRQGFGRSRAGSRTPLHMGGPSLQAALLRAWARCTARPGLRARW